MMIMVTILLVTKMLIILITVGVISIGRIATVRTPDARPLPVIAKLPSQWAP